MKNEEENVARELVAGPPELAIMAPVVICPGCQHSTIGRIITDLLVEMGLDGMSIGLFGAGCAGTFMYTTDIDATMVAHGRAMDVATAIKHARPDCFVFTVQGDGDCVAIGAESFLARLSRGERLTTIMCNNTHYATTGGQMAPTSLMGQRTSTTPEGRTEEMGGLPLHTAELAAGLDGVAYSARGALHSPKHYQQTRKYVKRAFQKQLDRVGYGFVEIISACPTVWRKTPRESLRYIEEEVIKEFPLGEFKNVDRLR